MLLIPGSLATAFCMPIIGKALQKNGPARLFSGMGFFLFYLFTVMLSGLNATSGQGDFFWPLIVRGIGLGLIFIPLMTITMVGLKGRDIPQGAGITNMVRQLGGSFGVALVATFIDRRTAFHKTILSAYVTPYSESARQRFDGFVHMFSARGADFATAHQKALALLNFTVTRQAELLSYLDSFFVVGIFFIACIPLLFLFGASKPAPGAPTHSSMVAE